MSTDPVYTVTEARALIPQVRAVLLQLALERRQADASHEALHRRLASEASPDDAQRDRLEADTAEFRARVRALLEHRESLGVVVRDLETGLVDLPTIREGEPAWLCWRLDDPDLGWWHSTREGYSSRRPL